MCARAATYSERYYKYIYIVVYIWKRREWIGWVGVMVHSERVDPYRKCERVGEEERGLGTAWGFLVTLASCQYRAATPSHLVPLNRALKKTFPLRRTRNLYLYLFHYLFNYLFLYYSHFILFVLSCIFFFHFLIHQGKTINWKKVNFKYVTRYSTHVRVCVCCVT